MPTYQYACTACEHRFEAVQSFADASLTECPECEGRLRKVFSNVGIVFKGSGFYRTDSRAAASNGDTPAKEGKEAKEKAGASAAKDSSGGDSGTSSASSTSATTGSSSNGSTSSTSSSTSTSSTSTSSASSAA